MNQDDKGALKAFKGMFQALSSSVRKKYEERARGNTRSHSDSSKEDHPIFYTLDLETDPGPGLPFVILKKTRPDERTDTLSDEGFVRSET